MPFEAIFSRSDRADEKESYAAISSHLRVTAAFSVLIAPSYSCRAPSRIALDTALDGFLEVQSTLDTILFQYVDVM